MSKPVALACACGHLALREAKHYEVITCEQCGAAYWLLQPKKYGHMQFFPHPKPLPRTFTPRPNL